MQKAYEFDFVYDTQAAFRLLLEALPNPGRIVELGPLARKLGGAYAMTLTVAAVLLDNEVSFAVCGSPALAEKITELTLAKTAAVSKADYIFVTENADWQEAVQAAKCGTLRDPHKSATVILCTADLQAGKLQRISGPGIKAVTLLLRYCLPPVSKPVLHKPAHISQTRSLPGPLKGPAFFLAVRRISAAFKDIQGGQILGATYDYTHRLIEFKQSSAVELCARRQCCLKEAKPVPVVKLPRVSEYLKAED